MKGANFIQFLDSIKNLYESEDFIIFMKLNKKANDPCTVRRTLIQRTLQTNSKVKELFQRLKKIIDDAIVDDFPGKYQRAILDLKWFVLASRDAINIQLLYICNEIFLRIIKDMI